MKGKDLIFTLTVDDLKELIRTVAKEEAEPLLTEKEINKQVKGSPRTYYTYRKEGMPYYRTGKRFSYKLSEVLEFLKYRP